MEQLTKEEGNESTIQRRNDNDSDQHVINTLLAYRLIKEQNKDRGYIECPSCKGRLSFSKAKSNGHIAAKCETKNCISFIE